MIFIKTPEEIKIMAEGGKILAQIMRDLKKEVKPGVTTQELNKLAEELIFKSKTKPAFLGYNDFPAVMCASVNEVIVHGIPSDYILKKGDILSLDMGVIHKGFYSDMAITVPVGEIKPETARLLMITKKSLRIALKKVRPGNTVGDIGNTIQRYIEKRGFNIVRELCGHGIGKDLHEDPEILNYGKRRKGDELKEGMVVCLEPMATMGSGKIKKAPNNSGLQTMDGSLSAHFEHMIAITSSGSRVLTE
ncbi:MAG: type I methionyl aminopeptidase [Patescibacteria group bacterium]|nr:type I methionyl aminopeptidase [Patescibacteria group bacterium]